LRAPDSTPLGDDVYLATDRSAFSAAEVRMLRVDSQRFSVSLRLPVGTQLRYEFTRGSFTSIERDRLGGIVEPRTIEVKERYDRPRLRRPLGRRQLEVRTHTHRPASRNVRGAQRCGYHIAADAPRPGL
jgi:hypothetical protein